MPAIFVDLCELTLGNRGLRPLALAGKAATARPDSRKARKVQCFRQFVPSDAFVGGIPANDRRMSVNGLPGTLSDDIIPGSILQGFSTSLERPQCDGTNARVNKSLGESALRFFDCRGGHVVEP